ncbi:MAG: haloalkane dehalogenase [Gammaproteobacteria bacterium]|nr:haloalkane dehalogenase [Gammaproteobacteria bacterium]
MHKKFIDIKGLKIAYVEQGEGKPLIFLHGNPTSSYLWRNIMEPLSDRRRCIALDLIGMGDSSKLPDSDASRYTFADHYHYLEQALAKLEIERDAVFVVHDWGSALGFHWANQHREAVSGICYMEAIVRPLSWEEFPESARPIFQGFRSPAGEDLILNKNYFVERVLVGSILRTLTTEEMTEYRRPFLIPGEDRRPTLTWPRQIPIDGEPEDVVSIVSEYATWLEQSDVPKLFINAEPGALLIGDQREYCRTWPNQSEVTVAGSHFIQEDSPTEISTAISEWLTQIDT